MARKHRQYENDYVSVTTLLSLLSNYGLMEWFKRTPYKTILKESARGKEIGTQAHKAFEEHIEKNTVKVDTEYPSEISFILQSFMLFKKENSNIKLKSSETVLISDKYKLNGTLDCIGEENEKIIIIDWKNVNSKDKIKPDIYSSYLYQLSAYVKLYEEQSNVLIDSAYSVAFSKDKVSYNIKKISREEIENNFNNIIMPLLQIYYYQKSIK